jgi:hypothetical protein
LIDKVQNLRQRGTYLDPIDLTDDEES